MWGHVCSGGEGGGPEGGGEALPARIVCTVVEDGPGSEACDEDEDCSLARGDAVLIIACGCEDRLDEIDPGTNECGGVAGIAGLRPRGRGGRDLHAKMPLQVIFFSGTSVELAIEDGTSTLGPFWQLPTAVNLFLFIDNNPNNMRLDVCVLGWNSESLGELNDCLPHLGFSDGEVGSLTRHDGMSKASATPIILWLIRLPCSVVIACCTASDV